jgi:hypothetical protein
MSRKLAGALFVCAAICLAQDSTDEFRRSVLPVLASRCLPCHNAQVRSGNLDLAQFRDSADPLRSVDVWKRVRDRLSAGTMPPPTAVAPSASERRDVVAWIDRMPVAATAAPADPGRVTARRLNRVEYDNTIRDLLGVNLHTAAEFPTDDSGYGFDNIGDVLSLSPLLMEKLMSSARRISRAAIYGEPVTPQPSLMVKLKPKRSQDDSPSAGDILPYSLRGALYGSYHFPVDAEYEFRWRYSNLRGNESGVTGQAPRRRGVPGAGLTPSAGRPTKRTGWLRHRCRWCSPSTARRRSPTP